MIPGRGEDGQPLECSANTVNFCGVKDDEMTGLRYLLSNRGPESSMIPGRGEDGRPLECSANSQLS